MIQAVYSWQGDAAFKFVVNEAFEGLARATVFLWTQLLQTLNVSAGPYRRKRTRDTSRGPAGSSYTAYSNPSKPGEAPRKRTGLGQRNVTYQLDREKLTSRIVIGKPGWYLDLLERHRDRPWLIATIEKHWSRLQAMVAPK